MNNSDVWQRFLYLFAKELCEKKPRDLLEAWEKGRKKIRTSIYKSIFQEIAANILAVSPPTEQLALKSEHCGIDFVIGKRLPESIGSLEAIVPVVAIESENEVMSAHQEIDKLCALSAPVKVLISCAIWSRGPAKQLSRSRLLDQWRRIRVAHSAMTWSTRDDTFGVVIGERTGQTLRFFWELLSERGKARVVPVLFAEVNAGRAQHYLSPVRAIDGNQLAAVGIAGRRRMVLRRALVRRR